MGARYPKLCDWVENNIEETLTFYRLAIVKPATVIAWHRRGFRLYWRWRSRQPGGRPRISEEVRSLIRQMRVENADWGAPKIHGELLKLGFNASERTVARYLPTPATPDREV
jgi:putative transposase